MKVSWRKVAPRREKAWGLAGIRVKYLLRIPHRGGRRERMNAAPRKAVSVVRVATAGGVSGHSRAEAGGGV